MKLFQSTHPQRVRQNGIIEGATKKDFNPRTRKGCDNYYARTQPKYIISIHAPAKGATFNGQIAGLLMKEFQSTHPQRVRQCAIAPFITKTKNLLNKLVQ